MAEVDAGCHNDDVFAINPSAQRASKKPQEKKKTVKGKQELCWFHNRFDAMSCYGFRIIQLQFQRRRFTLIFEIADVKKPILGANFLTVNGLVVDLQQGCITSKEDQHLVLHCKTKCEQPVRSI